MLHTSLLTQILQDKPSGSDAFKQILLDLAPHTKCHSFVTIEFQVHFPLFLKLMLSLFNQSTQHSTHILHCEICIIKRDHMA